MGLFFYTKISSIISIGDLPTTNIIEPLFILTEHLKSNTMVLPLKKGAQKMTTITLKVSEADKTFMKAMAKFEGVSLSELIRTKTLEALEDEYDARVADLAYQEYLEDLEKGVEPITWEEMMHDLGLKDE